MDLQAPRKSLRAGGFTLIELLIIIAVTAIIAAIALPNLLESRQASEESAAAAALRTDVFPAEVHYQAEGLSDFDGDGIGTYAVIGAQLTDGIPMTLGQVYGALSGEIPVSDKHVTLNLLPPQFRGEHPLIQAYRFQTPVSAVEPHALSDETGESSWAAICYPADGSRGRRFFAVNQTGTIYGSKPALHASAAGAKATPASIFGTDLSSPPNERMFLRYRGY
jgi:hypothetical protein